ncbi:hypothetical protein G5714_010188 [Onychostoma macrolepis]|uniref:Uncharacterized protein n=1 Tax=Onychostoma macrolepis TaxID=369639 RepID=A0A7J6CRA3_9TELE|nr:hypothetical protein G5714_010188 [Onychostoma macrolepis]
MRQPCSFLAHPYRAVTQFYQHTWVQQGSSSISGRETGPSRIMRDFVEMARQSATEDLPHGHLLGGLADPFKSMMPYWAPEESLEDYINLALQLAAQLSGWS